MKNSIKFLAVCFLAAVVGLSSCVKNDVSPDVSSLRKGQVAKLAAQVDKLNAEVTEILADASFTDAQTAAVELQNAFNTANNAFLLEENEAELAVTLAQFETAVATAEAATEAQKLAYEMAVNAYNQYITIGVFADNVKEYLTGYQLATATLTGMYTSRINKQREIAGAELLLTTVPVTLEEGDPIAWDDLKARFEADLAVQEALLAANEAALAALEEAYSNPADLQEQIDGLIADTAVLIDENLGYDTEIQIIQNDLDPLLETQADLNAVVDSMGVLTDGLEAAIEDSTDSDWNTVLEDTTAWLAELQLPNSDWSLATSTYNSITNELTVVQTAIDANATAWNVAKQNLLNGENLLQEKQTAIDLLVAKGITSGTVYDAAVAAHLAQSNICYVSTVTPLYTCLQEKFDDANAITGPLVALLPAIETRLAAAEVALFGTGTFDEPQSGTPQFFVASAEQQIDHINGEIEVLSDAIAEYSGLIEDYTEEYDAAVADLVDVDAEVSDLEDAIKEFTDPKTENEIMIGQIGAVIGTLENHIDGIGSAIDTKKEAILVLEDAIANLNKLIAETDFDKAKAEALIVQLEAELAVIEEEIVTQEAIVASWKALLDEAIAAGN